VTNKNSKPTIAFDTWILGSQARNHGIQVYAQKLLAYFPEMAAQYAVEIVPYVTPHSENGADLPAASPDFHPKHTRLLNYRRAWKWGAANLLVSAGGADLVFSPVCTTLYFGPMVRSVVTIHDLIPVVHPFRSWRMTRILQFLYWSAAKFSQVVITDSNHSKNDLINFYRVPESRISVVHLGCDHETFHDRPSDPELYRQLLQKLGITRSYIVHHGVIKSYKNLKRLIQAYRLLLERNRNLDLDLVLAGPKGWECEDILAEAAQCEESRAKVVFTGSLSDADLAMVVKGASLAVIPSLYEGFCLPLVESMASGVPTIASNASCLPEISGGRLRYFDPESVEEMSACMEEALENQALRCELVEKGKLQASQFDWRRCAEQTLAILARAAGR
jgi:glycosyltransferase involved in cell wall biosynthesis